MKLHLPKSLRAALLACLSIISPITTTVATSTMALGTVAYTMFASQATATDYTLDDDYVATFVTACEDGTITADDTITVDIDTMLQNCFSCVASNVIIENWTLTDGWSNTQLLFTGTITGSGSIIDNWSGGSNIKYYFSGDMSAYTGDIYANDLLELHFGGHDGVYERYSTDTYLLNGSPQEIATSGNDGDGSASGTGAIVSTGAYSIYYDYTKKATIANSSVTMSGTGSLYLGGGGTYYLATDLSVAGTVYVTEGSSLVFSGDAEGDHTSIIGSLELDSSSLTINANQSLTVSSSLNYATGATINNAGTLTICGSFVFTEDSSMFTNTGSIILSSGTSLDISAITSYDTDSDGNYTITLFDGGGEVSLADGLSYTDVFTVTSLLGKDVVSFENGILTFTDLATLYYSDGGSVNWAASADMGGDTYTDGIGVVFDTSSVDVILTGNVNPASVTISDDITVSISSSQYGFVLNCATIIINGSSTLEIDASSCGTTMSFEGSSITSNLQINVAEGDSYTDTSVLTSYDGNLIVSGSVNLTVAWSADGDQYNFASVTLLDDSSLYLGALTMSTDVSFASSSASSTLRLRSAYENSTYYDTIIGGYQGNLIID